MVAVDSSFVDNAASHSVRALHAGDGAAAVAAADDDDAVRAFDGLAASARRDAAARPWRAVAVVAPANVVVVAITVSVLLSATGKDGPDRYAAAMFGIPMASEHCDDRLGATNALTGARVVGKGMCDKHSGRGLLALRPLAKSELAFLVIGDWGRDGMCCQRDVAMEMATSAKYMSPAFVVNVGDSFYPAGIKTWTDAQINTSWRDVYIAPHEKMQRVPWKSVAGNHDYLGSIPAQIALSKADPLWHYPSRYYFEEMNQGTILLAFLDTTPMFYAGNDLRNFETSSGVSLEAAIRDQQLRDLKKSLSSSRAKFKLVFGHHPLISTSAHAIMDGENYLQMQSLLLSTFIEHNVTAYFSGHEHTMEHTVQNGIHCFVIGAGSKVTPVQFVGPGTVFALSRQGHLVAAVKDNWLQVRIIDFRGTIVHSADIAV
jgi:tartrate-resistant acid phosphatase type 5